MRGEPFALLLNRFKGNNYTKDFSDRRVNYHLGFIVPIY